ncbi:MAG TPA: GNAT family N-acetyltransferase [Acidimicrobiia bacterium]|nr:GNAT family N-acetyltransferase [Acidimicrobiia bacterium]
MEPAWDGKVYPVAGVETPAGTVLSVPPDLVDKVSAAGEDLVTIGAALPGMVGRPDAKFGRGVFRWCHELLDLEPDPRAVWLPPADRRVPPWLTVFNGDVLVHLDADGRYGGGLGRKRHDAFGQELSVATEQHLRGRGLARRLVAQGARRVAEEGAVATYLHAVSNIASARVAEAAGFPDTGWWVLGVPVAS